MSSFLKGLRHPVLWLESRPEIAWSLAVLYAVIIFLFSSVPYGPPQPSIIEGIPPSFKHVFEYSILGFLLLACFRSNDKTKRYALLFTVLLAGLYGASDEFHQFFVPYRTASFLDVLADSFGSFLGAFLLQP